MLTDAKLRKMTRAEIEKVLYESIFRSSILLEHLQCCGLVVGDGYEMRKKVSKFACDLLKSSWREEDEGKPIDIQD